MMAARFAKSGAIISGVVVAVLGGTGAMNGLYVGRGGGVEGELKGFVVGWLKEFMAGGLKGFLGGAGWPAGGICCVIRRISEDMSVVSGTVAGVAGVAVVIVGATNGLYVAGALVVVMLGAANGLYVAEGDGVLKCPTAGAGTAALVIEAAANGLYTGGAPNGLYPFVAPEAGTPNGFTGGDLSNRPTASPGGT